MTPALRQHAHAAIESALATLFLDLRLNPSLAKRLIEETRMYLAKTPHCKRLFLIKTAHFDGKPFIRISNKPTDARNTLARLDIDRWRTEWADGMRESLASIPMPAQLHS